MDLVVQRNNFERNAFLGSSRASNRGSYVVFVVYVLSLDPNIVAGNSGCNSGGREGVVETNTVIGLDVVCIDFNDIILLESGVRRVHIVLVFNE